MKVKLSRRRILEEVEEEEGNLVEVRSVLGKNGVDYSL
jgi:hypothetical protein